MTLTVTLNFSSFQKMKDIQANEGDFYSLSRYFAYIKVGSLLENKKQIDNNSFFNCLALNPRKQKTNTKLCKKIKYSLLNDENFCYLNKGILFSVKTIKSDPLSNLLSFTLEDENLHGNIDGGHTLKIIFELSDNEIAKIKDKFVFVEFITGIKDSEIAKNLSDSRNSVIPLDNASILNFLNKYEEIKEVFSYPNKSLSKIKDRIAYGKNDKLDLPKNIKKIDVSFVINVMNLFNKTIFNNFSSFNAKWTYRTCSTQAESETKFHEKYSDTALKGDLMKKIDIWDNIFLLWDQIEIDILNMLSGNSKKSKLLYDKSFLKRSSNPQKTTFYGKDLLKCNGYFYKPSKSFVFSILCCFNYLIDEDGNVWKINPLIFWNQINKQLFEKFYEIVSNDEVNNANKFGKTPRYWNVLWIYTKNLLQKIVNN